MAAQKATDAAARARTARAFAATIAAESVARAAAHAVEVDHTRAEAAKVRVSRAATQAARILVEATSAAGGRSEVHLIAERLAKVVAGAADACAHETSAAAADVATAVRQAAVQVSLMVQAADLAFESEVEVAAAELNEVTFATTAVLAALADKHA